MARMSRRATWIGLSLLVATLGHGCGREAAGVASERRVEFMLPSLDGRVLGPEHYRGEVLLVEFWATWCTPCRTQARILEELHREFAPRKVNFLAVSVGEGEETVRSFVEKSPFPYPVVLDTADELSSSLLIYALPTVMILDRDGQVVYFEPGVSPRGSLRPVLEEALRAAST